MCRYSSRISRNSITYSRYAPKLSSELRAILGVGSEVTKKQLGNKQVFDERIHAYRVRAVGLGVRGLDKASLVYSGKAAGSHLENTDIQFLSILHPGKLVLFTSYVDAATGGEKRITANSPSSYVILVQ